MGIRHAFVSAKSDGADPTEVQPSHWNADHVDDNDNPISAGGWDQELTVPTDQLVSASTGLVDASGLSFAVTSGSLWRIELMAIYSGTNASGDFRCVFNVTSGAMFGWYRFIGSDTASDAINVSTGVRVNNLGTTASIAAGTDASSSMRSLFIETMFRFTAAATFKLQWSQNSAVGTTTLEAGSILRGKRII